MNNGDAFSRVQIFLEESGNLPAETTTSRFKGIEDDISTLQNKLKQLHSSFPELSNVDLSENIHSLIKDRKELIYG